LIAEAVSHNRPLASLAKSIDEAAERGAQLTQRMLAFARKQPLQARAIDLNEIVLRMAPVLQRTLGEDITVRVAPRVGLWDAVADPSQVEDAILNLAINARDAMPKGGQLIIETQNASLDENYAAHNFEVTSGDYAVLTVTDSGTGMEPEVIERAFEPFFTTKDVGRGSGLGLSMVYGFVRQSGGHVKIYSELGHGTAFKLYLPKAADPSNPARETRTAAPPPRSRLRETILVVEDDPAVRMMAVANLHTLGYTVLQAEDGAAALKVLQTHRGIDLLFTDLIMPNGMNGQELLRKAREHDATLKALFTSGYSEQVIKARDGIDKDVPLIGKPFRRQALATKIREVLDQAPSVTR
jgi:CheY-like chemotaxis protein